MIDYTYYADKKVITTFLYGKVTAEELRELIDKLLRIECEGGMRGLVVMCNNLGGKGITYNDIWSAGENMHKAKFRQGGRNAIVARTSLGYGLARVYAVVTELIGVDKTKVYKGEQLNEAIKWLEIEELAKEIQKKLVEFESTSPDQ